MPAGRGPTAAGAPSPSLPPLRRIPGATKRGGRSCCLSSLPDLLCLSRSGPWPDPRRPDPPPPISGGVPSAGAPPPPPSPAPSLRGSIPPRRARSTTPWSAGELRARAAPPWAGELRARAAPPRGQASSAPPHDAQEQRTPRSRGGWVFLLSGGSRRPRASFPFAPSSLTDPPWPAVPACIRAVALHYAAAVRAARGESSHCNRFSLTPLFPIAAATSIAATGHRRFAPSGEPLLDCSRLRRPLIILDQFRSSTGRFPFRSSSPAELHHRHRLSSPRRPFRRLSPRAPPSARLAASSSPPCARGLDPAYSAPLAPLSAVAAASRALCRTRAGAAPWARSRPGSRQAPSLDPARGSCWVRCWRFWLALLETATFA